MTHQHHHAPLRLTPSNSPFYKHSSLRSPTKAKTPDEPGLRLAKVVGTTTVGATGFASLPSARQFAYTAGAAAVVATVGQDLGITQRFFRARPHAGLSRDNGASYALSSPALATESRSRAALGHLREHTIGGSPLGATAASSREWTDSPTGGKSGTAKERVKAATSVALSPNGRWLAVGETGYKPRVLIFANKGGESSSTSESPLCALADHSFGVHALAFSPDSRYLASLGTVNDGFLYVWSLDERTGAATLLASNKCTVAIHVMTWVGQSVLTVGLRFVKLWRLDDDATGESRNNEATNGVSTPRSKASEFANSILSPKHKVLQGKNCLLGDLLDAVFMAAVPLSSDKAVVCAESGELCLLNDSERAQQLTPVAVVDFRVTAARADGESAVTVVGASGRSKRFEMHELESGSPATVKRDGRQTISPSKAGSFDRATIATATIEDVVVQLHSTRAITLSRHGDDNSPANSCQLPAHDDAVIGVHVIRYEVMPDGGFLTFTSSGLICIWSNDGSPCGASLRVPVETSPEMYDVANELRAVAHLPGTNVLAAGDKYGTLRVLDIITGVVKVQTRAHSAEVVDMVAFERAGMRLIATGSRDRTVQLFSCSGGALELLQTMDEHAASVNQLLVTPGADILLSCSVDRSIIVREAVLRDAEDPSSIAYVMLRTIALKASPTSMCLLSDSKDELLVATADRNVSRFGIRSGHAGFSFKCSADSDGSESAAILAKILYAPALNGNPTIVGVASTDKSVRLYSEYGSLLARDWGHTEGITSAALLGRSDAAQREDRSLRSLSTIVTVAADSTIFIWDTSPPATQHRPAEQNAGTESPTSPQKNLLPSATILAPPLRKVLSSSSLTRFQHHQRAAKSRDETGANAGSGASDESSSSPTTAANRPASPSSSPQRFVKKKPSRISVAQAPRLEPAFRAAYDPSASPSPTRGYGGSGGRRSSLRKRSPSPPSPGAGDGVRHRLAGEKNRRPQSLVGLSARAKSSDNVLASCAERSQSLNEGDGGGVKTLTAATESLRCSLRNYRERLATSSSNMDDQSNQQTNAIMSETLQDLEKELHITLQALAAHRSPFRQQASLKLSSSSQGTAYSGSGTEVQSLGTEDEEARMVRLLDSASERFVGLLDERLGVRVGKEVQQKSENATNGENWEDDVSKVAERAADVDDAQGAEQCTGELGAVKAAPGQAEVDVIAGALEKIAIET